MQGEIEKLKRKQTGERMPSIRDGLISLKQLLDQGIITQEEFDAKTTQIINPRPASQQQPTSQTIAPQEDSGSFGWAVLGFFIPPCWAYSLPGLERYRAELGQSRWHWCACLSLCMHPSRISLPLIHLSHAPTLFISSLARILWIKSTSLANRHRQCRLHPSAT